jgi:hypothetical protein
MSWRFYPIKDAEDCGLLIKKGGKPTPAIFLTPQQAKSLQVRKGNAA